MVAKTVCLRTGAAGGPEPGSCLSLTIHLHPPFAGQHPDSAKENVLETQAVQLRGASKPDLAISVRGLSRTNYFLFFFSFF